MVDTKRLVVCDCLRKTSNELAINEEMQAKGELIAQAEASATLNIL